MSLPLKLTTWNVGWLGHAWLSVTGEEAPGKSLNSHAVPGQAAAAAQIAAVVAEIGRLDPDILLINEGPQREDQMQALVDAHLGGWRLARRPDGQKNFVQGHQGLWFLVRATLWDALQPTLVDLTIVNAALSKRLREFDPRVFRAYNGRWRVARPVWTDVDAKPKARAGAGTTSSAAATAPAEDPPRFLSVVEYGMHGFYRHPQILRVTVNGETVELIGAHLKSKRVEPRFDARQPGEDIDTFMARKGVKQYFSESHEARVKLTSEAAALRAYIDERQAQDPRLALFVLGDLNDGPGKELLEEQFLVHDLISNLQGEVFFAENYLNHALFDFPAQSRWSARFVSNIDLTDPPEILLDHILFTQAVTRSGPSQVWVKAGAGRVEHTIHDENLALHGTASDHKPVSVTLSPR